MFSLYPIPADLPQHACGRCVWFRNDTKDGNGTCLAMRGRKYYKCMVCEEYELDPEVKTA